MPGYLCAEGRAHVLRVGDNANPAIQAVGVPTRAYGGVIVVMGVGMPDTRVVEQVKVLVGQVEPFAPRIGGEVCAAPTVIDVVAVMDAPGIMKQGEQPDDLDDGPVLVAGVRACISTPPMIRAMNGIRGSMPGLSHHHSP